MTGKPLEAWGVEDVQAWLAGQGLSQLAPAFRFNAVGGADLAELTAVDLTGTLGCTPEQVRAAAPHASAPWLAPPAPHAMPHCSQAPCLPLQASQLLGEVQRLRAGAPSALPITQPLPPTDAPFASQPSAPAQPAPAAVELAPAASKPADAPQPPAASPPPPVEGSMPGAQMQSAPQAPAVYPPPPSAAPPAAAPPGPSGQPAEGLPPSFPPPVSYAPPPGYLGGQPAAYGQPAYGQPAYSYQPAPAQPPPGGFGAPQAYYPAPPPGAQVVDQHMELERYCGPCSILCCILFLFREPRACCVPAVPCRPAAAGRRAAWPQTCACAATPSPLQPASCAAPWTCARCGW